MICNRRRIAGHHQMIDAPELQHALQLLDAGDVEGSRRCAHKVFHDSSSRGDTPLEAEALLHLAHCDRVVSRFRRAHDSAQRAAFLFRSVGDARGEAFSFTTVAYAASSLARNEDAVEAALMAVHLSDECTDAQLRALAHNNLGIAYSWCRRFDKAEAVLNAAIETARASGSAISAFQPMMNLACAESWRLCSERFLTGAMPSAVRLGAFVEAAVQVVGPAAPAALMGGMLVTSKAVIAFFTGLAQCWSGRLLHAEASLDEGNSWAAKFNSITWLNALEKWFRAEIALARRDGPGAIRLLTELVDVASRVEHEHLACVGQMLLAQAHEDQGHWELATAELRKLRRREFQIRAESLDSRERVAQWQLEARRSSRQIESLRASSREFERLSLEDALTGISNRRFAESSLASLLKTTKETRRPLSVVFIDVDHFKHVNDTHSHKVGDQVLKTIAGTLRNVVREGDTAARLAGDEFLLILPDTPLRDATLVADRLRSTVAELNWPELAPGLHVTISAGIGQAEPNDTVESLLNKSDAHMYEQKGRTRLGATS